jgi:hypothetical protein
MALNISTQAFGIQHNDAMNIGNEQNDTQQNDTSE